MKSAVDQINSAVGLDRFQIIGELIDQLQREAPATLTLEDQARLLDLDDLAKQWDITPETLADRINRTLARKAVIKLSRSKRAIRQVCWLDYLKQLEGGEPDDV